MWLIRHAESLANAGEVTSSPSEIQLSEKGFRQAVVLAESISKKPSFIIASPFLRTMQTAEPIRKKFSDVPFECWNIQEFTYLALNRCRNTTYEQRKPLVEEFWSRNDIRYCEGGDTESLYDFWKRINHFIEKIILSNFESTFVFTHEQFIKTLIWKILNQDKKYENDTMLLFRRFLLSFSIPNTAIVKLRMLENTAFYFGKIEVSHLEIYA